MLQSNVAD